MSLEIQKLTTAFDVAANRIAELRFEADGLQRSYERTAKQLQEVQADRDVWVVAMSQIAQLAGVTLSVFLDGIPDPRKAVATICDALPDALLGLSEEQVRRKGTQQGHVRKRGRKWHIEFHEWRQDTDGSLKYLPTSRVVGDALGPKRMTKAEAEEEGNRRFVSRANGVNAVPQCIATVEQFVSVRFRPDRINKMKKSGRIHYRTMLDNHVLPAFGEIQLRDVTTPMIQSLINAKLDQGYSTQTVVHVRNVISALYRHAKAMKFYEGDLPTEGVSVPVVKHKERQALTWPQVLQLAEAMPRRHRALIIIMAQCGMRIGEAAGLQWRHVNLTDEWKVVDGEAIAPNSIVIMRNYTKGEATDLKGTDKVRKVPLGADTWVALMLHKEMTAFTGENQPVFAGNTGRELDAHNVSQRSLKTAAKKINLPWVTFHCLRHTQATLSDMVGITAAAKQKILGHRSGEMSVHYTHPEMEQVRAALDNFGKTSAASGKVN